MLKKTSLLLILMALISEPCFASIIKKPPVKPVNVPYPELICREEDQACIYEIITTVAENSKISLIFKQTYLNELGAKIDQVHPMKFLSTIVNHPHLRVCLDLLWPDSFKRAGFLEGFATSMSREADKGKLNQHIEAFAEEIKVPVQEIAPFFETRAWEDLVTHILRS